MWRRLETDSEGERLQLVLLIPATCCAPNLHAHPQVSRASRACASPAGPT